jgi:hypothetical protein
MRSRRLIFVRALLSQAVCAAEERLLAFEKASEQAERGLRDELSEVWAVEAQRVQEVRHLAGENAKNEANAMALLAQLEQEKEQVAAVVQENGQLQVAAAKFEGKPVHNTAPDKLCTCCRERGRLMRSSAGFKAVVADEKVAAQALYTQVAALSAEVESEQHQRAKAATVAIAAEERLAVLQTRAEETENRLRNELAEERAQAAERAQDIRNLTRDVSKHEHSHAATRAAKEAHEQKCKASEEALHAQLAEHRQDMGEVLHEVGRLKTVAGKFDGYRSAAEDEKVASQMQLTVLTAEVESERQGRQKAEALAVSTEERLARRHGLNFSTSYPLGREAVLEK